MGGRQKKWEGGVWAREGGHYSAELELLAVVSIPGRMPRGPVMAHHPLQVSIEASEVSDKRPLAQLAGWVILQGSHPGPVPVPAPGESPLSTNNPLSLGLYPKQSWQQREDGRKVPTPAAPLFLLKRGVRT